MTRRSIMIALSLAVPALAACDTAGDTAQDRASPGGDAAIPGDAEAPAPAAAEVTLATDSLPGAGPYLTDGDGRAVYLFTADSAGTSACYDACAEAWPPLMARNGGATAEVPAIQQSLIGTTERRDGGRQVTYGGHPLYYFARDTGPGDTAGQDVHGQGGEWYLVALAGEPLEGGDE